MRIERLDLISYGPHRNLTLDLRAPTGGLVVVVGPNEAGKSTAMRALDALLFGIERGSPDHFGRGRETLRIGARIRSDAGHELEFIRQGLARTALTAPDGSPVSEVAVADMVGNVERSLFRAMFRIDHAELTTHSEALLHADGEIGRLVFGASLGGAVALNEVLARLDQQAERLFKPGGRNPELNRSLSEYRALSKEARDQRVRAASWAKLDEAVSLARRQVAEAAEQLAAVRSQTERLTRIREALPRLVERQGLLNTIGELEAAGPVADPEWFAAAINHLALHDTATRDVERLRRHGARIQSELEQITVVTTLVDHEHRISKLYEQLGRYDKDRADLPKLSTMVTQRAAEIEAIRARIGPAGDPSAETTAIATSSAHSGTTFLTPTLSEPQRIEISQLAGEHRELTAKLKAEFADDIPM